MVLPCLKDVTVLPRSTAVTVAGDGKCGRVPREHCRAVRASVRVYRPDFSAPQRLVFERRGAMLEDRSDWSKGAGMGVADSHACPRRPMNRLR